jgi:hypothetical protein
MITKDEFEELMNESAPLKVGKYEFFPGTVLRECDPIAFDVEYHDYCDAVERAIEEESV